MRVPRRKTVTLAVLGLGLLLGAVAVWMSVQMGHYRDLVSGELTGCTVDESCVGDADAAWLSHYRYLQLGWGLAAALVLSVALGLLATRRNETRPLR